MLWCWFDWYYTIQRIPSFALFSTPSRYDLSFSFQLLPIILWSAGLSEEFSHTPIISFPMTQTPPHNTCFVSSPREGMILRTKSRDAWHLSSLCLLRILDLLDVLWKGAIGVKWDALSMLDIWSLAFRLYFHLPRWTLDPFLSMPYPCPIPTSLSHPPSGQELEIIELTLYTAHNHLYASTLDNPDNWGIQVDQNTPEKIVRIDTLDSPGIGWTDKWVWPWNGRRGWSYL